MKTVKCQVLASLFFFLLSGSVFAGYLDQEYKDMDADGNGSINWNEFRFYERAATPELFSIIDQNSNSTIEFREWVTYQDRDYPFESKYRKRDRNYFRQQHHYRYRHCEPYPRYGFSLGIGHGHSRSYYRHYRHDHW